MRLLSAVVFAVLALPQLAFGHSTYSTHRTHIVDDDGTDIQIVREDGGEQWASYKRDGVRYVTTDPTVLAEIDKAMEKHRELSRAHSRLGRQHSELGREHSALGREHSRLGREYSRLARNAGEAEAERLQRDLERSQRTLEAKQRELEDRQRELENKQRELEEKHRVAERDAYRAIEKIFERAVRDGKAKRD